MLSWRSWVRRWRSWVECWGAWRWSVESWGAWRWWVEWWGAWRWSSWPERCWEGTPGVTPSARPRAAPPSGDPGSPRPCPRGLHADRPKVPHDCTMSRSSSAYARQKRVVSGFSRRIGLPCCRSACPGLPPTGEEAVLSRLLSRKCRGCRLGIHPLVEIEPVVHLAIPASDGPRAHRLPRAAPARARAGLANQGSHKRTNTLSPIGERRTANGERRTANGERRCRPPVAWDHPELSFASSMGPPLRQ